MAPEPFDVGGSEVGGGALLGGPSDAPQLPRSPGYGWLVECDTGLELFEWQPASALTTDELGVFTDDVTATTGGGPGVYVASVGKDVRCIDAVHEDGVALVAVGSIALVDSTAGSWYFDAATGALWVHTTDDDPAATKTLVATVVECYKFGPGTSVFLRNGVPQVYQARLKTVPGVTLTLPTNEIGVSALAEFGELTLDNEDGYFSGDSHEGRRGLVAERFWAGRAVRSYRGEMDLADRDLFTPWSAALMERPRCVPDACTVPLVSRARLLSEPLCPTTFELATYPGMAPELAGVPIPEVYGPVVGVEAMRIASGRWKVAGRAMTAITACKQENGAVVTINTTDLALGEFEVSVALNNDRRLYVDGTGRVPTGRPGALLSQIAQDGGVAATEIDAPALAWLDEDLPVAIGLQVLGGTVREALERVAVAGALQCYITRLSLLGARAIQRDQGNLIRNPSFEVDAAGWTGHNGATVARTTTHHARGVAALEITKDAAQPLGYARVFPRRPVVAGQRYAVTCLVGLAPGSPPTNDCRIAIVDAAGNEELSDPFPLVAGVFQVITFSGAGIVAVGVTTDLTTVFTDSTTVTTDLGEVHVRVYPQHGGMAAVVLLADVFEWVETMAIAEHQADVVALTTELLQLYRARVRYAVDGRTGEGSYATAEAATLRRRYPAAESQQLDGELVASADAALVAAAVLDYYGPTRARLALTVKDPLEQPITLETVIELTHRRAPGLVNHSGLWRVVSLREGQAGDNALPVTELELVAHYDPAMDRIPV